MTTLAAIGAAAALAADNGFARADQPMEQPEEYAQALAFGPTSPPPPAEPTSPAVAVPSAPAEGYAAPGYAPPPGDPAYGQDPYSETTLIPPNVEGNPYVAQGGGYCYVGPHPVDTRVVPGVPWDDTRGQHLRPYPPLDTRLFALRDGCYYFTGDPRDFGYAGQTYNYYGAHPVLDAYGGGWCFMMGGHTHLWSPWSPYFTVVGPWYYWHGPYDPFFWAYWPYYSFYYRSYYPHYYGGGRFYRGGYRVAPPIRNVPASAWRGGAYGPGRSAPAMRGAPPSQMYRSAPATTPTRSYSPSPAPRPSFSSPPRSFAPSAPSHGGSPGTRGGSFHGGRR